MPALHEDQNQMKRKITGKLALLSLLFVVATTLSGDDIKVESGRFDLTDTPLREFVITGSEFTLSTPLPLFLKVKPELLRSGEEYSFQIGAPDVFADGNEISIKKICGGYGGDKLLYDETVCVLHNVKMQREELPIKYGMSIERDDEPERFLDSFPYGRDFIPGGCVVTDNSPKKVWAYVCPVCRKNYLEWKKREAAIEAIYNQKAK
jgi:hypothetical protein